MNKLSCNCGTNCKCKNCQCGPRAQLFGTLGSETRLYILDLLRKRAMNVTEMTNKTGLEQTLVSHSLKQLEQAGLVESKREGKYRIYAVTALTEPLMKLVDKHAHTYFEGSKKQCCCEEKNES